MNPIKNIIFDLGGVIVDLDIKPAMMAFAQLGLTSQNIKLSDLSTNGIPKDWEMARLMHAMDRGDINARQFIDILHSQCRPDATDEEIINAFNRIIVIRKQRLQWLLQLRNKYRVFLLSNLGEIHWTETLRQSEAMGIRFEDCFDDVFLSYLLRMAKPDPRIFTHVIETTGIVPNETLYIDDLPDNIEVGQQLGLQAHKVPCNGLDAELLRLFPELIH